MRGVLDSRTDFPRRLRSQLPYTLQPSVSVSVFLVLHLLTLSVYFLVPCCRLSPAAGKVTVGLASQWPCMLHRLQWLMYPGAEGLRKADEHPANTPPLRVLYSVHFIASLHRHERHDKTVLSVSRPLRRCELDSRQLKTVADGKFEV